MAKSIIIILHIIYLLYSIIVMLEGNNFISLLAMSPSCAQCITYKLISYLDNMTSGNNSYCLLAMSPSHVQFCPVMLLLCTQIALSVLIEELFTFYCLQRTRLIKYNLNTCNSHFVAHTSVNSVSSG